MYLVIGKEGTVGEREGGEMRAGGDKGGCVERAIL